MKPLEQLDIEEEYWRANIAEAKLQILSEAVKKHKTAIEATGDTSVRYDDHILYSVLEEVSTHPARRC